MVMALAEPPEIDRQLRIEAAQARISELMGIINTANAALIDVIAEALADELWPGGGIRSPEHWVTWRCGVSAVHARALVASARRVADLPACAAAFRAGELSEDQMAVIARHTPADLDGEVLALARYAMVPQLSRGLRSFPDPDRDADPNVAPGRERGPQRMVSFGNRDDGLWFCTMLLPPDEGAVVQRMIEAGRDAEFADRHPDGDRDPTSERADVGWADGIVRAAEAAAAGFASGLGRSSDDRYQVLLHVNVDAPDRSAHLHLGPAVPASLRRLLSCDATLRIIFEQAGVPVADSRLERTVSRRLRRLVENRDRGCRVPGCTQTRWLHVHHLVHWEDGGRSDLENLVALCPFHHRRHHLGQLDITGRPNARPKPPDDPLRIATARLGLPPPRWRGPTGERLDYWCLGWNRVSRN